MNESSERLANLTSVPEDFATAIGYLSIAYSFMETDIDLAIWEILGLAYRRGPAVTDAVPDLRGRLTMLDRLVALKVTDEDLRDDFEMIKDHIDRVIDRRRDLMSAQLAHWPDDFAAETIFSATSVGKIKRRHARFTVDEIYEVAEQTYTIYLSLEMFIEGLKTGKRSTINMPLRNKPGF